MNTYEHLEDRVERLEEALHRIAAWADAYPLQDAISAAAMRHVVEGVGQIARHALA